MIRRTLYNFWKIAVVALGILLILFGVIGLFLPILQGILMILAGLFLVGKYWDIKAINDLKAYLHSKRKVKSSK